MPRVYIGTTWTARAQPGVAPKVLNPKSSAGLRCHAQGAPAAGWQGRTTPADRHRARPGQGEAVDGSPGHNPIVTIVYYIYIYYSQNVSYVIRRQDSARTHVTELISSGNFGKSFAAAFR